MSGVGVGARIKNWQADKALGDVKAKMRLRMSLVGEMVASKIRENISDPTRTAGPSLPGAFPHADTGRLRNSIEYAVDDDGLSVRVGTNVEYGGYLELGTDKMEARPFLEKTIYDMEPAIRKALKRPL